MPTGKQRVSEAIYFPSPAAFRRWLAAHHATAPELLVGFHKRDTGRPSLTWSESVDEALCFGWIDGVRRSVDDGRYTIRFTPRRPRSTWSAVNLAKVEALSRAGRMQPAGMAALVAGGDAGVYSYEQRREVTALDRAQERRLRADAAAWADWQARPPWYRRSVAHWVASAKREETREARLATLVACSARGEEIPPLRFRTGKASATTSSAARTRKRGA